MSVPIHAVKLSDASLSYFEKSELAASANPAPASTTAAPAAVTAHGFQRSHRRTSSRCVADGSGRISSTSTVGLPGSTLIARVSVW